MDIPRSMVKLESFAAELFAERGSKRFQPHRGRQLGPPTMTILGQLPWLEQKKIAAWTRCRTLPGRSPQDWRVDDDGTIIRRANYGVQGEYGWEVDHIRPLALSGTDTLDNVRALHCRNNRSRGGLLGNALKGLMTGS